jgi:membrane-associated phospholipid phosphatase
VYYEDLAIEDRINGGNRNSFFSGHVSSTATGTFFTAKVLADHHPEWGAKRWLLYGLAGIPPTIVAIQRVRALRHFPTDTIIGGLTGVLVGIGIPELHRRWKNKVSLSAVWQEDAKGLALLWTF